MGHSWWMALWIYGITFLLVSLTFFQNSNANDKPSEVKEEAHKSLNTVNNKVSTKGDIKASNKKEKSMLVLFETTQGPIKIKLDSDKAPKTVENFLKYVDEGFYKGTVFHRVIKGFMIQGGGFTPDMNQKSTHPPIKNEANNGLKNKRGTLAMARTSDPNSASSQFFINHADNAFLDFKAESLQGWGYAVFGEVIEGMDVVDKIAALKTGNKKGHDDVPDVTIEVTSAKRVEK